MIGTTLGHYRIVAELGAGGMGVVYRAADERLGRDVALKVLPAGETADEASRARLMREARTASALNHPHVCTIYEIAEGHTSVAAALFLGDWDWVGAEREARRALELSPGSSEAMFTLASVLGGQGRAGESIEIARRARDRDPGWLVTNWCFGEVLLFAGRYDEALVQARHTLALDPASPLPTSQIVLLEESRRDYVAAIGAIDAYQGQTEEGKALVTALRAAYASTGPRGYARVLLDRSPSPSPLGVGRSCFRARLCALLGEREQALDILEAALAAHDGALLFLNVEPGFESLRGEPRFKAMVTKIGLSPTGSPGNL